MQITLEIYANGTKCWYKDDAYHREGDHPAVIHHDGSKEYHLDGELIKIMRSNGSFLYTEEIDRRQQIVYTVKNGGTMVKLVMHLNPRQAVVEYQNDFYLVSESRAESYIPLETLVFPCDENGHVSDWSEVDGELGLGIKDFLPKLLEKGYIHGAR